MTVEQFVHRHQLIAIHTRPDDKPPLVVVCTPGDRTHAWTQIHIEHQLRMAREWVDVLEAALGMLPAPEPDQVP